MTTTIMLNAVWLIIYVITNITNCCGNSRKEHTIINNDVSGVSSASDVSDVSDVSYNVTQRLNTEGSRVCRITI